MYRFWQGLDCRLPLSIHLQARHSLDESSTDLETGIHTAWRSSAWSKKLHGAALFTINEEEGELEIPTDGLYLVYAQVSIGSKQVQAPFCFRRI